MATPTMEQPAREALARRDETTYQPPDHVAAVAPKLDLSLEPSTYVGMSETPVDEAQAAILSRPLEPADVDIRPDGQVYMSHAKLRQRLNEAFRPGGWAIRRLSSINVDVAGEAQGDNAPEFVMSAEFALYAGGRFLSAARGEQKYYANGDMTYGDAAEGMKSNAISRCCKDLGIALDLWDRNYAEGWRQQHAMKLWGEDRNGKRWRKPQWRKADALPLYGETGPTDDSPNQDRYVQPTGRRRGEPSRETRQATADARYEERQQAVPATRQREPGDDDEPVQRQAPRQEAPRPPQDAPRPNGGRTISEAQQKRLYAKATAQAEGNMTKDEYRSFIRGLGYESDREIPVSRYDDIVAEATQGGGRR